jgi:hypothetical protein
LTAAHLISQMKDTKISRQIKIQLHESVKRYAWQINLISTFLRCRYILCIWVRIFCNVPDVLIQKSHLDFSMLDCVSINNRPDQYFPACLFCWKGICHIWGSKK